MQSATSDYRAIAAEARAQNPAAFLPKGIDPTVLAGYIAQRNLIINEFEQPDVAIGTLHWGTSDNSLIYHLKPLSRGTVNINTTDPLASPVLDYRTGTDPIDLKLYVALFRKTRQLFAAPDMAVLGPTEASPFGSQLQTDDEIIAVLRQQINPSNAHQCCTAAMQPRALGGVVDSQWRVYGVQGLRVGDVSYWPFHTSGAPTATVYASGERVRSYLTPYTGTRRGKLTRLIITLQLADVIKAQYNLHS